MGEMAEANTFSFETMRPQAHTHIHIQTYTAFHTASFQQQQAYRVIDAYLRALSI